MKKTIMLLILSFLPLSSYALASASISEADGYFAKGGLKNYQKAIDLYLNVLKKSPESFEANWKCARAYREYGEISKKSNIKGWKETCAVYGKQGMKYGQIAAGLKPDHPAGYYYCGLSVGIYSDGKSIFTAIKEGLKNLTQTHFEKAYELDKMYDDAGPVLALGRFWAVLPWPMADRKKALAYYREYQKTPYFHQRDEGRIYLSELLIKMGGKKNKAEAKTILKQVVNTQDLYFKKWANRLLAKLK